jgi:hypothetical protein
MNDILEALSGHRVTGAATPVAQVMARRRAIRRRRVASRTAPAGTSAVAIAAPRPAAVPHRAAGRLAGRPRPGAHRPGGRRRPADAPDLEPPTAAVRDARCGCPAGELTCPWAADRPGAAPAAAVLTLGEGGG